MVLIAMRRVKASLRGKLSRWMLEIGTGVFVGSLSARVRDLLWEAVCAGRGAGECAMVFPARNEQGFLVRSEGEARYEVIDREGLQLVRRRIKPTDRV
jgi:CRISPR-associated protein Cas2